MADRCEYDVAEGDECPTCAAYEAGYAAGQHADPNTADFYEDDEPVEDLIRALQDAEDQGLTRRPVRPETLASLDPPRTYASLARIEKGDSDG